MNGAQQLAGFRIAVTSDRRSNELIEALERRGAETAHTPLLRLAPLEDEQFLLGQTRRVIAERPSVLVVTTAYGLRRWFDTAEAAGLGDQLGRALETCRIFTRGAKALGAVRALGLPVAGSAAAGTSEALLQLLHGEVQGASVAVQMHADNDRPLARDIRALGAAHVLKIEPYRWLESSGAPHILTLLDGICAGRFDAVTFTSAPSVHSLLTAAASRGMLPTLIRSFNERVLAATVGPVTAEPLIQAGVRSPLVPQRHRMGAMVLQLATALADQGTLSVDTSRGLCQLRGRTLSLNDEDCTLTPLHAEILRCLLQAGGNVVSRDELATSLSTLPSRHALDMTLSRLRKNLPDPQLITTVIKRGYRIA
ncbi:uroporphyrinogen-III synthase [Glutamicibacter soli]|uniref:Uroporphyrinogen-III synthase n=1 Tax=Glutamicibacter soli TaxID=453836 RepID=A0A365YHF7_9MICC|nr:MULTISPECIES: uroporphyrinogen-III synthase [Micrococcaceae]ALQ29642.1 hypothetical protein ATC04_03175 [Arthrobacter sp. YC-RL1]KLI88997.1 hypothetical protein AA310_14880 [Arthrobacter sp. YC-RL1]RBM01720.1 uroporphyrinogen-III synthase [Glutamicibacter soli]